MTETTAISTRSWPGDGHAGGTIGPVSAAVELKLVDIPAMGYTAENVPNPRGEICVRGSTTFGMYYKDEKNTKEAIDAEGWVHTGDVGEIDACGRFKIIDRVKNIMKLAQGEYVALEKVENAYATCPAIAQLYVHGDGLQAFLIGVVVADPVQLAGIVSKLYGKAIAPTDVAALEKACTNEQVVTAVLGLLDKEAKRSGLKGFETIRRIHLTLDLFTVDEGTLTPTFKLKRKEAYGKFKAQLDALYAGGEPAKARL